MKSLRILLLIMALTPTVGRAAVGPRVAPAADLPVDEATLLARSQISYRAEGGFSGVEAYGVIVSCVNGEISVLSSIHDPRLNLGDPLRHVARISPEQYLTLWRGLVRHAGLKLSDGPAPRGDVADEFTVTFNLSIGDQRRQFTAHTLSLPSSARYTALRQLIDETVRMSELWTEHDEQISALTSAVTFESLQANLILENPAPAQP